MIELRCSRNEGASHHGYSHTGTDRLDDQGEVVAVLGTIGLAASDAFRLMMVRIAAEKR